MDEALRLDYLDAMGITQYVARAPLPGARPSPVIELAEPSAEQPSSSNFNANRAATEMPHLHTAVAEPAKPARLSALLDSVPQETLAHKPEPTAAPTATPANSPAAVPASFQCQLAIWTVEDLLLIADAPRLDNQQIKLLRNILQAIGRKENLSEVKQFSWPLQQRKERSLLAAREHFQGMLDGGFLSQRQLRQIICFGSTASTLLADNEQAATSTLYRDWPVITVEALHGMLAEPARKVDTWRALQVLVRT